MVKSSALLPFVIRIGDHLPIIIKINTMSLIGQTPIKMSRTKGRIPKTWIPRVRDKYTVLCERSWRS